MSRLKPSVKFAVNAVVKVAITFTQTLEVLSIAKYASIVPLSASSASKASAVGTT